MAGKANTIIEVDMGEAKEKPTLEEQRESLQESMKIAMSKTPPDMKEYHRLNKHLQWLENKIRRKTK